MRPEGPAVLAATTRPRRVCRGTRFFTRLCPMTLPGSPHIAYRDKDLFIEDRKVADLAREFGTPLYAYS